VRTATIESLGRIGLETGLVPGPAAHSRRRPPRRIVCEPANQELRSVALKLRRLEGHPRREPCSNCCSLFGKSPKGGEGCLTQLAPIAFPCCVVDVKIQPCCLGRGVCYSMRILYVLWSMIHWNNGYSARVCLL
jgi:hypothetical protein